MTEYLSVQDINEFIAKKTTILQVIIRDDLHRGSMLNSGNNDREQNWLLCKLSVVGTPLFSAFPRGVTRNENWPTPNIVTLHTGILHVMWGKGAFHGILQCLVLVYERGNCVSAWWRGAHSEYAFANIFS
jgi:hypothetical protein